MLSTTGELACERGLRRDHAVLRHRLGALHHRFCRRPTATGLLGRRGLAGLLRELLAALGELLVLDAGLLPPGRLLSGGLLDRLLVCELRGRLLELLVCEPLGRLLGALWLELLAGHRLLDVRPGDRDAGVLAQRLTDLPCALRGSLCLLHLRARLWLDRLLGGLSTGLGDRLACRCLPWELLGRHRRPLCLLGCLLLCTVLLGCRLLCAVLLGRRLPGGMLLACLLLGRRL